TRSYGDWSSDVCSSDLESPFYEKLVATLLPGPKENREVTNTLHTRPTGRISEYLQELNVAGFIKRDYTWDIGSALDKPRLSRYRSEERRVGKECGAQVW